MPYDENLAHHPLNIRAFGVKGDGLADDTAALQRALDAAGEARSELYFPPGHYLSSQLCVPPNIILRGCATWNNWTHQGSVIQLIDAQAECLLDCTKAKAAVITGLALDGLQREQPEPLGADIHGIMVKKPEGGDGEHEDYTTINRCLIRNFSGDGIHFNWIWCFMVRHSAVMNNYGYALRILGYDGQIIDNVFMSSRKGGIGAERFCASLTISGNRLEHNRAAGIALTHSDSINIVGNFFDANHGPAIALHDATTMAITGNMLRRNGFAGAGNDAYKSSHLYIDGGHGVVATGNTMKTWHADGQPAGEQFPKYGMVLRGLADSIITNNVLHQGAVTQLVADLGEHGANVIIAQNVGSVIGQ